jgi:coenzyme F420-reducing hydrogenase delta subunit
MVKRADAIMVTGGHIFVIEYKVGARLRKARNSAALELLAGPSLQPDRCHYLRSPTRVNSGLFQAQLSLAAHRRAAR